MAERAYYQMRIDALMVDVSLEMAMINYLISICYVVDDRCSPTFLGVPNCALRWRRVIYLIRNSLHQAEWKERDLLQVIS